jgi:hypothetical protein
MEKQHHRIIVPTGQANINDIYKAMSLRDKILNPYTTYVGAYPTGYEVANYYEWWNDTDGCPKDQCLFSFYGYIRADRQGSVFLVDNTGGTTGISPAELMVDPNPPILLCLKA